MGLLCIKIRALLLVFACAKLSLDNSFEDDFFIIDKGRETDERSIVLIEEGIYRGYGYVHLEELNNHPDELKESIKPLKHHPEIVKIIHSFLSKDKKLKRLIF